MAPAEAIEIREFQSGDEEAFKRLNEEWIVRYFVLEKKDVEALAAPRQTILDRGGRILFAVHCGIPVGCCALVAMSPGEFEVAKMAVTESAQGLGIGRRLLAATIEVARAAGASQLFLETNSVLAPAIRLYESVGFRHIPADRKKASPYARSDVQMELILR
jgi:GNAT superfamily N-acetyltransferase